MDHFKILRRAFQLTWSYRALWLFGILLALTTASSGVNSGGGGGGGGGGSGNGGFGPPGDFQIPGLPDQVINILITAGIVLACLILLLIIAGSIVRYVSETALIRMVDEQENTGEKLGVRQGFRLGWSRPAFRIFLIDLIFGLGGLVVFLLLLLVAAAPLLVWLTDSEPAQAIGTVAAIGLAVLVILLGILAAIAYSLLVHFFRRAAVLEDLGVVEAIRQGFARVRQRLGEILVMGVIMFALGLAWVILMIPVFILLLLAGVAVGALPGLLAAGITSLFAEGATPWIVGGIVGVPVFLVVVIVPTLFVNGLVEVFKSSTWTLTYRELVALEATPAEPALEENVE